MRHARLGSYPTYPNQFLPRLATGDGENSLESGWSTRYTHRAFDPPEVVTRKPRAANSAEEEEA